MKRWSSWPLWIGWGLLLFFALARGEALAAYWRLGLLLGLAAVPLLVLPLILRSHEKRIARLEREDGNSGRMGP